MKDYEPDEMRNWEERLAWQCSHCHAVFERGVATFPDQHTFFCWQCGHYQQPSAGPVRLFLSRKLEKI